MTLDHNEAFALYFDGEEAHDEGDLDAAMRAWGSLVDLLDQHDLPILQSVHGTLPRAGVRMNLAILGQQTRRWAEMRRHAEKLVEEQRTAGNLQLLATALKNDGDPQRARQVIEEAVALDPMCANAHHEHACILAAEGELDAALQSMGKAIDAGGSPQSLLDDDELSMMNDVAGFDDVVCTERWVDALIRRMTELSDALAQIQPASWGQDLPSDAEIELFEDAYDVARTILDTTFADGAPHDGDRIALARLSAVQRRALDAFLACEPLWKGIPFLNLMGELGLPSTTVQDARRQLLANPD